MNKKETILMKELVLEDVNFCLKRLTNIKNKNPISKNILINVLKSTKRFLEETKWEN